MIRLQIIMSSPSASTRNTFRFEHTIYVNKGKKYWIKVHRNNQYIPYFNQDNKMTRVTPEVPYCNVDSDWIVVQKKKKHVRTPCEQPIYYWVVSEHNMFDTNDTTYRLFFTEPDATQIENVDQNNHMAIDKDNQLQLINIHLKHNGMKMTPTYFVARSIKQIGDALQFVKYCVVKTEDNEQKIIDLL